MLHIVYVPIVLALGFALGYAVGQHSLKSRIRDAANRAQL